MLQKSSREVVLNLFLMNPTKQWLVREISRNINIAHTSVKKYIDEFVKERIILQKTGLYPSYILDRENEYAKFLKKYAWIELLHESGFVNHLRDSAQPRCIILFGSANKGDDIESSDLDIFIEADEIRIDIQRFEEQFNRKINLHFTKDLTKPSDEFRNNIINGTLLYGYLKVF